MYHPLIESIITGGDQTLTTILFLLCIPIILTILNIMRYFVGIKGINIFAFLSMVFLYYTIGTTLSNRNSDVIVGMIYGSISIAVVLLSVIIGRNLVKFFKFHYSPKVTITLITSCISIFLMILIANTFNDEIFVQINPITVVFLVIIAEEINDIYGKGSLVSTVAKIVESSLISIICYLFISLKSIQDTLLIYPWIIFVVIFVNFLIGKFTGLRLTEYLRFSDILIDKEAITDTKITQTENAATTNTEE